MDPIEGMDPDIQEMFEHMPSFYDSAIADSKAFRGAISESERLYQKRHKNLEVLEADLLEMRLIIQLECRLRCAHCFQEGVRMGRKQITPLCDEKSRGN